MIINLFVITGILMQLEKEFNEKPDYSVERILLQSSDARATEGQEMKSLKEKSGRRSPFEYDN